jgi:hypothetical protein
MNDLITIQAEITYNYARSLLIAEKVLKYKQSNQGAPRYYRKRRNSGDHGYAVIVHCGGCMLNSREMQYRMGIAREHGVYITNYGVLIAYVMGILPRALQPFPAASMVWEEKGLDDLR